jgi:hypothetical protein
MDKIYKINKIVFIKKNWVSIRDERNSTRVNLLVEHCIELLEVLVETLLVELVETLGLNFSKSSRGGLNTLLAQAVRCYSTNGMGSSLQFSLTRTMSLPLRIPPFGDIAESLHDRNRAAR